MIAASSSGSGKTTLTMGILRALARRGIDMQPFKCGPDYIDPIYHKIACGRPSINLDIWMNGAEQVKTTFNENKAEVNVIEAAMGLYDGANGREGSASEIAELLDIPVFLVINAQSMAHSVAPLLHGYKHWRPETRIEGVIFNNVGSERHYAMLQKAAEEVGIACLGYLPRQKGLYSPSRHLGLDISETQQIDELANKIADQLEKTFFPTCPIEASSSTRTKHATDNKDNRPNIYVAHDAAFNFIYTETLQLLKAKGTFHLFSPLANEPVPEDADIVYLPGGYPEFFLDQLEASNITKESLRNTKARIVAECGGMMYIGKDIDGREMADLLPHSTTMQGARLHLGYRTMIWNGMELRGHEFHYSNISSPLTSATEIFNAQHAPTDTSLFIYNNVIAGYTHWSPHSLLKLMEL